MSDRRRPTNLIGFFGYLQPPWVPCTMPFANLRYPRGCGSRLLRSVRSTGERQFTNPRYFRSAEAPRFLQDTGNMRQ
jgi:hypothetical protein